MTTMEWLRKRREWATSGEKSPAPPPSGVPAAPKIPENAPTSPDDSLFDFGRRKYFPRASEGRERETGAGLAETVVIGACRGNTGVSPGAVPGEILLKRVVVEENAPKGPEMPYLARDGTLVIPFGSPERYHWWKLDGERLHVWEIRAEFLPASMAAVGGTNSTE